MVMSSAHKEVILVNPNRMQPPIAPIGLDYIADALVSHGYEPMVCDLSFAPDWEKALADVVSNTQPIAVGFSVRNIDDAYFATQHFVLEDTTAIVAAVRRFTPAPIVLGGVGFSIAPAEILRYTQADYGVIGDGHKAFVALLDCLSAGEHAPNIPGVIARTNSPPNSPRDPSIIEPNISYVPSRRFFDNYRYYLEGGQGNIETKSGCDRPCTYCVDPVAKGRRLRLRQPASVAAEIRLLCEQGIDVFHFCDSEFNVPLVHARSVCEELVRSGLASHIKWYAYAVPEHVDKDTANLMAKAGCVGLNFGVDHTVPEILKRLGKRHNVAAIQNAVESCRGAGIVCMCDMLLGAFGETRETLKRAVGDMQRIRPDRVGLSCGVRIYPNTPLAAEIKQQGHLDENPNLQGCRQENEDLLKPIFYVEREIGENIYDYVASLVQGDSLFFLPNTTDTNKNYNYDNNEVLCAAIRAGARGAYWDILRRIQEGEIHIELEKSNIKNTATKAEKS